MTNRLFAAINKTQHSTYTENGALAIDSANDALVNLFAVAGALRNRNDDDICTLFAKAMAEDKLLATRMAFYTRDIRGGLGERRTGRLMLRYLADNYPDIFRKNLPYIAEYGRYDDLVYLLDTAPETIVAFLKKQLNEDIRRKQNNEPISLLAKWLPSVNTSNKDTVRKGRYLAKKLGMTERDYRKLLAEFRAYLKVVEVDLSAKNYGDINYPQVPSKAMTNYRNAFLRNDEERFRDYLGKLVKGEAKINSAALYPYDVVEKYLYGNNGTDTVLEEQWKALPNYVEGNNRFLVMADVSGSMYGRPMATSVGLAMYFAERNKGPFANTFMTFSSKPELVTIKGDTLYDRIKYIQSADWSMSTNLEAAFYLVLQSAINDEVAPQDMPDSIVVITDMEFDRCVEGDVLFYEQMSKRFAQYGYAIPNIVFWNVNSRRNTYHASYDTPGIQLASGQSPSVFQSLLSGVSLTPYEYMLSVLNTDRYAAITV